MFSGAFVAPAKRACLIQQVASSPFIQKKKTREGWNCRFWKHPATGLPFPVPEVLEFRALRASGNISPQFSRNFPPELSSGTPEKTREAATALQSHPPVIGVLKWEILESALGSAPEGAPGNRGAPGVLPRVLREIGGAPGSAPESALSVDAPQKEHSREHSLEHPNFPEHSREHSPEHPDFPEHPREHFREHFQGFPTLAPL